jgi:type I restriction enzyme, S subunit
MIPRDRSVPWRGRLANTWDVGPLKYVVKFNPDVLNEDTDPDWPIHYVDISSVDSDGRIGTPEEMKFCDAPSRARRIVQKGDVIVSTVRTYLTAISRIEVEGLTVSTGFAVLRPCAAVDSRFLGYWMRSRYIIDEIVARSTGVSYPAINPSEIGQLPFPNIDVDEQRAIADFLDRETCLIDDALKANSLLAGVLNGLRERLIETWIVGGGPSRKPMRRSGIGWLPELPAHWKVLPLKRLATRVSVGIAEATTHAYSDEGIPLIRSTNVWPNRLDLEELLHIQPWFATKNKSKTIFANDLLTVRSGVNFGDTAVVPPSLAGAQCFTLLITSLKDGNVSQFFSYFLNSRPNRFYFDQEAWGAAQANLSVPILQNTPVPVPPPEEQAQIVCETNSALNKVERQLALLKRADQQLRGMRSGLISAAVTGQIDVRTYRPQEAAAACV